MVLVNSLQGVDACSEGCSDVEFPKVDWLRVEVRTATSKGAKPEDIVQSYERWIQWVEQVQEVRNRAFLFS